MKKNDNKIAKTENAMSIIELAPWSLVCVLGILVIHVVL